MKNARWPNLVALALVVAACGDSGGGVEEGDGGATTTTSPPATTSTVPEDLLGMFPSDGLLAAFFADEGVTANPDTTVSSWSDATGSMILEPTGAAPRVVAEGHAGRDLIRFMPGDGPGFTSPISGGFPAGNTDRTLIVAGKWIAASIQSEESILGAGWGDPQTDNGSFMVGNVHFNCFSQDHFGVTTNLGSVGTLCGGQVAENLLARDVSLVGADFLTVVASVDSGSLSLYVRDREVSVSDHVFETVPVHFWIGNWQQIEGSSGFDVVAVLAYDRALTQDEITQVVVALRDEFGVDG